MKAEIYFYTFREHTLSSTHYSITLNGISGQSGSFIDFTINSTSPNETIQYNCSNHNGMGANLNISDSFIDEVVEEIHYMESCG